MSASEGSNLPAAHAETLGPAIHAQDASDEPRSEHAGEDDDDDMDFEPTTEGSDENEFFDPEEDPEAGFHGQTPLEKRHMSYLPGFAFISRIITDCHCTIGQMPKKMT